MLNIQEEYSHLWEKLKTERDELNVQMHLAKAEIRDEWQELETKWEELRGKGELLRNEASHSSEEIAGAAKLLGEEIKKGFQNIRNKM